MLPEHPFTDIGQVGGSFVLAVCGDSRAGALPALHARILPDVGVNMGACRALRLAESRCQTRLPRVSQRHDSGLASCAYVAVDGVGHGCSPPSTVAVHGLPCLQLLHVLLERARRPATFRLRLPQLV